MKVSAPELLEREGMLQYRVEVSSTEGSRTLWFSVQHQHGNLVSSRSDAALVALLIPAMARGEDIEIGGTLSERLYYNLSRPYQRVLQEVMPSLQRVNIHPSHLQPASEPALGVATGFSAGIDSFCAVADHHSQSTPTGFRLTHLLYNNVGSHGAGAGRLFRMRFCQTKEVAERLGLPLVAVDSNVGEFYDKFSFAQTHTPRNSSVAILLQNGLGRFFYASAYSYRSVFVGPTKAIAFSDPVALPLLSTGKIDLLSVGSEHTRVEKTLRTAEVATSHQSLDVCVREDQTGNCSNCWKCRRTLLTLEIGGVFGAIFFCL